MLSCHMLDPPSVSHAVTRPAPVRSDWVDIEELFAPRHRHAPARCGVGDPPAALLSGRCPNPRRHRALHEGLREGLLNAPQPLRGVHESGRRGV